MALTTTADYKTSRSIGGTDFDTRIAAGIAWAEMYVREYCDRDTSNGFESATRTEVYDGTGTEALYLREWPVTAITSVKFRTGIASGAGVFGDTVASSSYLVHHDGKALIREGGSGDALWCDERPYTLTSQRRGAYWPEGSQIIEVVYTGGFSTIPATLAEAVHTLVDVWMDDGGRNAMTLASSGRGIETRSAALPADVASRVSLLLREYARLYR